MPFLVALLVIALVLTVLGALLKAALWLLLVGILLGLISILGFGYKLGRGRR